MLDDLIQRLMPYSTKEISVWSGVSLTTIEAIMKGSNKNPNLRTIQLLVRFCNQKEKENGNPIAG